MGSIAELNAANLAPPILGKVAVIATSTSSARTNLAAAGQLSTRADDGSLVTLIADGTDVYIAFNNADSGSISESATTGATSCWKLEADVPQTFRLAKNYTWLLHKAASGTPNVRAFTSSFTDTKQLGT